MEIILNKEVKVLVTHSCLTPRTTARQAPLSMGFSRQQYWTRLPCPSPGNLPYTGIEAGSPTVQAGSFLSDPPGIRLGPKSNDTLLFKRQENVAVKRKKEA